MTTETITKLAQQFVNENYSMSWHNKDNMVLVFKEFGKILEKEKRKCVYKIPVKIQ